MPNLQNVSLLSDILGVKVKARLSTHAIRSIEKNGGLDNYLLGTHNCSLSSRFRHIKKLLQRKNTSALADV
jgi:large subunit ribosomal protein L28